MKGYYIFKKDLFLRFFFYVSAVLYPIIINPVLFDHSKYLYKTILFFSSFFFFYIYFYLFFCNSCPLGLISLKKPFLMSVIFTGINKRVIKVFLTTTKKQKIKQQQNRLRLLHCGRDIVSGSK